MGQVERCMRNRQVLMRIGFEVHAFGLCPCDEIMILMEMCLFPIFRFGAIAKDLDGRYLSLSIEGRS